MFSLLRDSLPAGLSFGLIFSLVLLIACSAEPEPDPSEEVTWHGDVAPIFAEHCTVCHRSGGVGGFALDSYDDAKVLAVWVSNTVRGGKMPPWTLDSGDGCEPPVAFRHESRLSSEEVQAIEDWADAGAPEGDPATAAELPAQPDRSLGAEAEVVLREGGWQASAVQDAESYRCFLLDPGFDEQRYVTGLQVAPDALEVLHHVFAYRVPEDRVGEFEAQLGDDGSYECFSAMGFSGLDPMMFWLPDTFPMEFPGGSSLSLGAGDRILLQAHYHTWEAGAVDATSIALRSSTASTERSSRIEVFGNEGAGAELQPGPSDPPSGPEFRIPAFEYGHIESIRVTIPDGSPPRRIFGLAPRLNYAGESIRVWLEKDGGDSLCLGDIPDWSIDSMRFYAFDEAWEDLPRLEAGDAIVIECGYDNTSANDDLRSVLADAGFEEPQDMVLGGSPLDEQCMVALGLTTD